MPRFVVPAVDVVRETPHVLLEVLYGEFRPLADEAALQLSEGREYGEEHAPRRRGGVHRPAVELAEVHVDVLLTQFVYAGQAVAGVPEQSIHLVGEKVADFRAENLLAHLLARRSVPEGGSRTHPIVDEDVLVGKQKVAVLCVGLQTPDLGLHADPLLCLVSRGDPCVRYAGFCLFLLGHAFEVRSLSIYAVTDSKPDTPSRFLLVTPYVGSAPATFGCAGHTLGNVRDSE